MKFCKQCKVEKSLVDFGLNKRSKDGLNVQCKECIKKDYHARKEILLDRKRKYYSENKEVVLSRNSAYYRNNKVLVKDQKKKWVLKNRDKVNYYRAKRNNVKSKACPRWLTKDQHAQIKAFYSLAKSLELETGVEHHVDHIVPLQGLSVCGLHVPWNLQVLTAEENRRKSNNFNEVLND